MKREIIGICGYKGSGKDTVGNYLEEKYGFKKYGLADPMKSAAKIIFLWDDSNMDTSRKEEVDPIWGVSPRQVLQHMGTEWGQYGLCEAFPEFKEKIGRKLWITRFKILVESSPVEKWVITDVRFPHEVETVREMGGKIIKVVRLDQKMTDPHESEAYVQSIKPDAELGNGSSLEVLYANTDEVIRQLRGIWVKRL